MLRAGRWHVGVPVLAAWLFAAAVLVRRARLVPEIWFAGIDGKLAVLTLGATLGGLLLWSWSDPSGRRGVLGPRWHPTVRAFQRNRLAVVGAWVVAFAYLLAVLAPLIAPYVPGAQGDLVRMRLTGPSGAHLLGTDHFARDILSRMLFGARVSLSIGFIAVAISATLGTLIGAVAGYLGGWVDAVLMRGVDIVISFPRLILLITVIAVFEKYYQSGFVLGFWDACLTPVEPLSPGAIRALREREHLSQPVFARYLNVSKNLVSDWERGVKRPGGPALRLLTVIEKKGIQAIA